MIGPLRPRKPYFYRKDYIAEDSKNWTTQFKLFFST